ncbi:GNAT family N-acetyltransferase [Aliivibrio kagoshimensis]|uniref:GNAT family N-acetyltransferase n=1 Tax=Aliivibrio kagoshimensis TaxID=2910230 RepID=UPI003D09A4F0
MTTITHDYVTLKSACADELNVLYHLITDDEQWTQFNGPYFPYQTPTIQEFEHGLFRRLCLGDDMLLIMVGDKPVGSVSYYWECEVTRWLEMGIILYDPSCWCHGLGRKALIAWIDYLFESIDIERVGLTTWSGNPRMMSCAERLGLKQEARIRKVRYYQGYYYDSVKYGVLRDEWREIRRAHKR